MKPSWAKAALALASGGSNADAARAAGVTSRTVTRWRADEVATLSRVLAAQNQATVSIQREWRMWSDALLRMHVPEGIDASKWLATLST